MPRKTRDTAAENPERQMPHPLSKNRLTVVQHAIEPAGITYDFLV
jgi:hypothetical protein